jgi:hypothetical protein
MQVPFIPFMLKEITIKCCLTYTDEEFRDVVDAFVAGTYTSRTRYISLIRVAKASSRDWRQW